MMRGILFILLAALTAAPAAAADRGETRWYDVELIVFTQNGDDFLDAEAWPEVPRLPELEDARLLLPAPEQPARVREEIDAFQSLTPGERQLNGAYRRLEASSRFKPLIHLAWRQPGLDQEDAVPVRVTLDPEGEMPMSDAARFGEPDEDSDSAHLDGTVTLILSRYLHLKTDLLYRIEADPVMQAAPLRDPAVINLSTLMPSDEAGDQEDEMLFDPAPSAEGLRYFVVNSSRRMRSSELHYLDHPVLGVIALITPYEMPEPPQETVEAAPTTPARGGMIAR